MEPSDLQSLRNHIDEVDKELVALLTKRALYAKEIGKIKTRKGIPVKDEMRETAVLCRVSELALESGGFTCTRGDRNSVRA